MKNTKIVLLPLLLFALSACEDYLSEKPDNRIELDSGDKISEILVNAYPQRNYFAFAETMTDNVEDTDLEHKLSQNYEQNYIWQDEEDLEDNDSQANYWKACYSAIAHANEALATIDKLGNPPNLNPQKGEALMARAYAHFMLVCFWSERYDPKTAKTALGIPIVSKPEDVLIANYKRNTIEEVYDFIENDILQGLPLLKEDSKHSKFHFNKASANAFAARFYLSKGNWDKVIELSDDLGDRPLTNFRNLYSIRDQAHTLIQERYGNSQEPTNLLIVSALSSYEKADRFSKYYFGYAKVKEIFKYIFGEKPDVYQFFTYNLSRSSFVPKFLTYTKYSNITKRDKEEYTQLVLFSNEELFLNRIEAKVMKGQIKQANDDLQHLLSIRTLNYDPKKDILTADLIQRLFPPINDEYSPFYALTPLQTSYIKAIAETRRKEYLHEGLRWFDIKRFNIPITHEYLDGTILKTTILLKNDKRRVLQIPPFELLTGLEKNPR